MTINCFFGIPDQYADGVMSLLTDSDKEFVPALSSRNGTTQCAFGAPGSFDTTPTAYFKSLQKQHNLLMMRDNRVVGLMSFTTEYVLESPSPVTPNVYVSTVVISTDYRRRGLARALYERLFYEYPECHVFIRTWSSNEKHVQLLGSLGFRPYLRYANDRGPGVDTIYYHRSPTSL